MSVVANLVIKISASVTDFEKSMAGLEKTLDRTGAKLQSIGGDLTKGLTLPIVAIGGAAFKMSMDFDSAMTKVRTLASESAENIGILKQQVLDLAPSVGIGPTQLADALLVIESTGFRGAQALSVLEMSAKASAIGMGDTKDIARALTAAVNAYGIENLSAARAADILTATVDAGGAEASELATEIGRVVGVAAQVGVSFEQVGAFIATYTKLGVPASIATTGLSNALNMILNPTHEARVALAGLGMSADSLRQAVKDKGLDQALIDLLTAAKGDGDVIGHLFGNVRELAAVMGTAGSQAHTYQQVLKDISNSADTLNKRFDIWRTTTAATWKEFTAQVQVAGVQLGDKLAPSFSKVLQAAGPVLDKVIALVQLFGSLPQPVQTAVIGFTAFAAAVGPIVYTIGTLVSTAGALVGLLGSVGLATTGAGTAAGTTAVGYAGLAAVLGTVASAVAIVGTAFASLSFGSWLGDVTGLTDAWGHFAAKMGEIMLILPRGTAAQYAATQAAREQAAAVAELHKQLGDKQRTGDIELASGGPGKPAAGTTPVTGLAGQTKQVAELDQQLKSLMDRLSGNDVVNTADRWVKAIGQIGGIGKLTHEELTQFTSDITKAVEKMQVAGIVIPESWQAIANGVTSAKLLKESTDALGESLKMVGLNKQGLLLPSSNGDTAGLMNAIPADISGQGHNVGMVQTGETFAKQFKQGWSASIGDLGTTIMSALTGGGDVGKSIGSLFGGNIMDSLSGKLTGGLKNVFHDTIGGALGAVLPGLGNLLGSMIGPLIGKVAGKLWHGIQGAFGTDEEARDVNPARDQFLSQFGNVADKGDSGAQHALAAKLTEITGQAGGGPLMDALLKADTMDKFNTALKAVQDALAKGKDTGQQAADNIGTASDAASGLTLNVSGSDDALKALGETQDRVVNAMLKGFDTLMAKLDEFVATLTGAGSQLHTLGGTPGVEAPTVPAAAAAVADATAASAPDTASGLPQIDGIQWPHHYDENGNLVDDSKPGYSYAGGSGGIVDFGAGSLAMLHGREAVLTEDQMNRLGFASGGASSSRDSEWWKKNVPGGGIAGYDPDTGTFWGLPGHPNVKDMPTQAGGGASAGGDGGGLTINVTVHGGTVIGNSAELRHTVAMGTFDAIEQGGVYMNRFRVLAQQVLARSVA